MRGERGPEVDGLLSELRLGREREGKLRVRMCY